MERIEDIKNSYEFQNFTVEELQKIKLIKEILLLEYKLKETKRGILHFD
jgi:hypothetical protein